MSEFIVSIRDKNEDGGDYYTVPCAEFEVRMLEAAAQEAGLKAVVRRADTVAKALRWMRQVASE